MQVEGETPPRVLPKRSNEGLIKPLDPDATLQETQRLEHPAEGHAVGQKHPGVSTVKLQEKGSEGKSRDELRLEHNF